MSLHYSSVEPSQLERHEPPKLGDGLRVVVDCAHGAAYKVAPTVFWELGAEVFSIGVSPDGLNINRECGALTPEQMRREVLARRADLGIALDGDADRLIVVDERGEILDASTRVTEARRFEFETTG